MEAENSRSQRLLSAADKKCTTRTARSRRLHHASCKRRALAARAKDVTGVPDKVNFKEDPIGINSLRIKHEEIPTLFLRNGIICRPDDGVACIVGAWQHTHQRVRKAGRGNDTQSEFLTTRALLGLVSSSGPGHKEPRMSRRTRVAAWSLTCSFLSCDPLYNSLYL